jgi:formyl-CoA transferase
MSGVLEGIRVLDMGHFVAVPSAGAVLADWGADVLKVEPLTGEPQRGVRNAPASTTAEVNWRFEVHNRNKRSLALDLTQSSGTGVLRRLVEHSDVFMSNYEMRALARLGIDYARLSALNPRLIYATLTAYGTRGPEKGRRGFDMAAAWARTGLQHLLAEDGGPPPQQRGGVMDRTAGFHIVAGVTAALFHRERTGQGQQLEFSLYHTGIWTLAADLQVTMAGVPLQIHDRRRSPNPLVNTYRTRDGRWLQLAMLQADLQWPGFCAAVGRPDYLTDPRFTGLEERAQHIEELIAELDVIFATKDLAEWEAILAEHDCIFGPVRTLDEAVSDPQAEANGFFTDLRHPTAGQTRIVATPVGFRQNPASVRTPAPEVGQHTEEVLLELGYDWEDIARFKDEGAIP